MRLVRWGLVRRLHRYRSNRHRSADIDRGANIGGAEGAPVAVAVGETDVQHMYMNVDQATVPAGTVTFTVANEGVKKHEFVVCRPTCWPPT